MGFFDFVEKDDGKGLFADLGGKTECIGGTITNEPRNVVGGNKFIHVEADEIVFAVEIDFGESFGELGLTDTGGAEEKESANGAVSAFDAGTGAAKSVGNGGDGFDLVNHASVNQFFEIEKLGATGVVT